MRLPRRQHERNVRGRRGEGIARRFCRPTGDLFFDSFLIFIGVVVVTRELRRRSPPPTPQSARRSSPLARVFDCACGRTYDVQIHLRKTPRAPFSRPEDQRPAPVIAPRPMALTAFETELVSLIADGLTDREIARELTTSVDRVKRAVRLAIIRLAAKNRTEAAVQAVMLGIIGAQR